MTLEQILSEFDKEFPSLARFGPGIPNFIRTSFSKYQEELVAAIEGMKWRVRQPADAADEAHVVGTGALIYIGSGAERTTETHNNALDQVIKLIKEN